MIKIRQRQTGNVFAPEYDRNLADHDAVAAEGGIEQVEENIDSQVGQRENALKQKKTAEQQAAAQQAYKDRQKAIQQSNKP